jgi:hypothetical protein
MISSPAFELRGLRPTVLYMSSFPSGLGGKPTLECGHLPLKFRTGNSHQAFNGDIRVARFGFSRLQGKAETGFVSVGALAGIGADG